MLINLKLFLLICKKPNDVVSKEVVKNKIQQTKNKSTYFENKIPMSTLTKPNQYNTDKQNLEKKNQKLPDVSGLVTSTALNLLKLGINCLTLLVY